ncbi:MAG: SulP family inorganic anion transporter [Cytophagales bacterium]|nr:SulP family inorganic anion transporter [Cytophagales bacterium]
MDNRGLVNPANFISNLKYDLPAGLVVFLVALPLCLGISLASGAPFSSGLIAGVIGGLLIPHISKAQLSVSGPAAGLTTIVLLGVETLGTFEALLVAIFLSGFVQIALGLVKAGYIAYFFPSSVIKGMLAAIGSILIMKQLPYAIGYHTELAAGNSSNPFSRIFESIEWGAFIIGFISLGIFILWKKTKLSGISWLPAALIVTVLSILINQGFWLWLPELALSSEFLVNIPKATELISTLKGPDWSTFGNRDVYAIALTIGIIASVETLLTIEAVDKLDPYKRKTPLNRELIAQGFGNCIAGLIGGLPITSVIVRSSTAISSGGRTKMIALFHGILLFFAVMFLPGILSKIPLAALAAILLTVGFKLADPRIVKSIYKEGSDQWIPMAVTTIAILLSDLLVGIGIGIVVGLFFVLRANFHSPFTVIRKDKDTLIIFNRDVSFLNKAALSNILEGLEKWSTVEINGKRARFIDHDIGELLREFETEAKIKNITVKFTDIESDEFSQKPIEYFS